MKIKELLIGTYTRTDASEGIYTLTLDDTLQIKTHTKKEVTNPTYLLRDGNIIYTIESNEDKSGGLGSYRYDDNQFIFLDKMITEFAGPCHLDLDKTKQYIVTSHYHAGKLELHHVDNGKILALKQVVDHKKYEDETNPTARVHFAQFTADNNYIITCDLGLNRIVIYPFDAKKGIIDETGMWFYQTVQGSGPRHFTFNETGDKIYVLNELSGSLLTFDYADGRLTLLAEHLPDSVRTHDKTGDGAAIHFHPNGRYLYTSLRSTLNLIIAYELDEHSVPQYIGEYASNGNHPRDFNITPDGKHLIVANQFTDNMFIFAINEDGSLIDLNKEFSIAQPVCVYV